MKRSILTLLACLIAATFASAADSTDASPAKEGVPAEKERSQPVFYLRDQSKIAGAPKFDGLDVETLYGKLTIPRDQLVRIRFARRVAPEIRDKIQQLITELGNEDFDKREAATASLREVGVPALDALRKAAKSSNEEIKNRAGIIVTELDLKAGEPKAGAEELLPQIGGTDDEIVTMRMTIKGMIPNNEFLIESRYGELKVATADLAGLVFRAAGPQTLKVDVAPSFQPPGNWFDTKLEVEKGQRLKIDAAGQVNVRNYGITAGPDGNRDWGGTSFQNFPMLSLVGKIGKRGQPFLIGNAYNQKARGVGRLYVAIVAFSPNPGGANGGYKLNITASGGE